MIAGHDGFLWAVESRRKGAAGKEAVFYVAFS